MDHDKTNIKAEDINKNLINLLEKIISLSRRSYSNAHNASLSLKFKLEQSNLAENHEQQRISSFPELKSIHLLCIQSQNVKLVENCILFYTIMISQKLIPDDVINSLQDFLDDANLNVNITLKILQMISNIHHFYKLQADSLRGYLSFCIKMADCNDGNIQSAARHTTLEMCLDLIDNFEIYSSERIDNEKTELLFSLIVFIRDVFRMLILDEPPHWLGSQIKSHHFLLELLSCILTRNPSIFNKIPDLNQLFMQEIVPSLIKILDIMNSYKDVDIKQLHSFTIFLVNMLKNPAFDKNNLVNTIDFFKIISQIVHLYYYEMKDKGIKILVTFSNLTSLGFPIWIRFVAYRILHNLLRESKYTTFIIDESAREVLTKITTFCLKSISSNVLNKLSDPNKEQEDDFDFWEQFFEFHSRAKHYLWDDISQTNFDNFTYKNLMLCSAFVILSIPRILYDYIHRVERITDKEIESINKVMQLIYPSISCLIPTCTSVNAPIYDFLLETVTLLILVSNKIKVPSSQNIFLKFLCDLCVVERKNMLNEQYYQMRQNSVFYAFCDVILFHSVNMDIHYWRLIAITLLNCSYNFRWPSCSVLYSYFHKNANLDLEKNIVSILDRFFDFMEHDPDFKFSSSLKYYGDSTKMIQLDMFTNVNKVFKRIQSVDQYGLLNFISAFQEISENLSNYKLDPSEIFVKRSFIIGRLFDIFISQIELKSDDIIEKVLSIYIIYTKYDCDEIRAFATQFYLVLLLILLEHNPQSNSTYCIILGLEKIIHYDHVLTHPYIINVIRIIFEDHSDKIEIHWKNLIKNCCYLLRNKNALSLNYDKWSYKDYIGKQYLLILHKLCDQSIKYLNIEFLTEICTIIELFTLAIDNVNSCFVATGYFMTISDFFCDSLIPHLDQNQIDGFIFSFFVCLSRISIDSRLSLRKSVIQMFLSIIEVRSDILTQNVLIEFLENHLVSLLIRFSANGSEPLRIEPLSSMINDSLVYHHTRNTPQKQWCETFYLLLEGSEKIFTKLVALNSDEKIFDINKTIKYFSFLEEMILGKTPEYKFNSTVSIYNICDKLTGLESKEYFDFSSLWIFIFNIINKFYKSLIEFQGGQLPCIKHQLAMIIQISGIILPKVSLSITSSDIETWGALLKIFLYSDLSIPNWFIPRYVVKIFHESEDIELMDLFHIMKYFVRCHSECMKQIDNDSVKLKFVEVLFDILEETLRQVKESLYGIEEIILTVVSEFYTQNIHRENFISLYPRFLKIWNYPLSLKFEYNLPNFWFVCVGSLISVSSCVLKIKSENVDITADIIELIEMLDRFFFSPTKSTSIVYGTNENKSKSVSYETEVINFITNSIIPLISMRNEKISHKLVFLLLSGFLSVTTSSTGKDSKILIMPREVLNETCLKSLIDISFCLFDCEKNSCHNSIEFSNFTLNLLVDNSYKHYEKLSNANQKEQDISIHHMACSLKAALSIFKRSYKFINNTEILDLAGREEFYNILKPQLLRLYDLCVNVIRRSEILLRELSQEGLTEFRKLIVL